MLASVKKNDHLKVSLSPVRHQHHSPILNRKRCNSPIKVDELDCTEVDCPMETITRELESAAHSLTRIEEGDREEDHSSPASTPGTAVILNVGQLLMLHQTQHMHHSSSPDSCRRPAPQGHDIPGIPDLAPADTCPATANAGTGSPCDPCAGVDSAAVLMSFSDTPASPGNDKL